MKAFHTIRNLLVATAVAGIVLSGCSKTSPRDTPIADPDNGGLTLPAGFAAFIVADDLGPARHLDVAENGDIYVALNNMSLGSGAVALRDTTGDGRADVVSYFGSVSGTGIKLHKGFLYFGADTAIVRYPMQPGSLVPGENYQLVAFGFPNEHQHEAKPIDFDPEGYLYVNVGAPANACMEQMRTIGSPGMDPCPILDYAGGIWRFKDDVLNQFQLTEGYRFVTGTRNCVALRWNPVVNKLYAVMHGRDQLHQFFPELYDEQASADLPGEEFLLLEEGTDFGWPYCYYDPFKNSLVLAPEYGGDGTEIARCESKTDPIMAFPAHTAPNDLLFYTGEQFPERYRNGAFIAFHGSWNRAPLQQEGYYVVFLPMEDGLPSGNWEVFADGFSGRETVMNPGDAEHRPVGLAIGPDGSLYISDSRKGTIWRVIYTGEENTSMVTASDMETETEIIADVPGEEVYKNTCLVCHQADGNGVPGMHPPLRNSEWVTGDKERLILVLLRGMKGEIEVNGEIVNSVMPAQPQLNAGQIADVLTFIRQSFGNDASEVSVEEVQTIMDEVN